MNRVYLFSLPELLTEQNLSTIEIKGLAEWSDHTPALFLLLLGRNPGTCVWAVYTDGNHPPALVCDWADASARLDRFCALAATHSELAAHLAPIRTLMHAQANRHLVLHVSELAFPQHGRSYDKSGFRDFMAALALRADVLGAELDAASMTGWIGPAQPALSSLLALPAKRLSSELGYWDARVEAGYWLDHDEPDEIPDFLREFDGDRYSDRSSGLTFDPKLGAYEVRSVSRNARPRHGIATAYGRWLLPLGELQPLTNRYDEQATRSWIVVVRALGPANGRGDGEKFCYGLLDANGQEILPLEYESLHTVGDKLVYFRTAAEGDAGAFRLMRIDTAEVLPGLFDDRLFASRGDGRIEVGRFNPEGDAPARGLIDFDGRPVTEFIYDGISRFHRRNKVAIAIRNGKCGLINSNGQLVSPMAYDRIAQHRSDGPPHFHGDATLIFTAQYDEQGQRIHRSDRVGVIDKNGKVLAEPVMEPWHLQWTFDKAGAMLVHRDGVLYRLFADGSLSGPEGSYAEVIEALREAFSPSFKSPGGTRSVPPEPAGELDREACLELIDILCRDVAVHGRALRERFAQLVAEADGAHAERATEGSDDDDDECSMLRALPDDGPAAPYFRVLACDLRDAGLWMYIDWKAVDEIAHAASHMPDLVALKTFCWDGEANGEGMDEGFAALDEHLSHNGYRLIQYRTDGDEYVVGAVAAAKFARCLELARMLRVPLVDAS